MIPYEKYDDDPDYLLPGGMDHNGQVEKPLSIQEVFLCPGCGRAMACEDICDECLSDDEILHRLWSFKDYRRPAGVPAGRGKAANWAVVLGVAACAAYLVFELCPMIADWICGGVQ